MISTIFETENWYDFVTIGDTEYSGAKTIDIILPTNFTVAFHSNFATTKKGFVLNWNCLSHWEEWAFLDDGTCREAIGSQPPYNGPDRKYQTKYRQSNETCKQFLSSKFIIYLFHFLYWFLMNQQCWTYTYVFEPFFCL